MKSIVGIVVLLLVAFLTAAHAQESDSVANQIAAEVAPPPDVMAPRTAAVKVTTVEKVPVEPLAPKVKIVEVVPPRHQAVYYSTSKGPYYYENEYELRARKLARGVANVTLCVAEVPNQMFLEAYRSSPVTGAVVGAFKGVVKGSKRFAIGLWEIATFYHPTKNHYRPYIEPEVVFQEYMH